MKIYFWTFSKKYNSTLRPAMSGYQEYECVLKSNTGVIAPTIELNLGLVVNPSAYNFAYIPDFGRYYWVQEWDFVQSTWIASLSVDVLATWRPYIGNTDMYVYRSSYEYDGKICDTKYQTTDGYSYDVQNSVIPHGVLMDSGYYIVSIYGGDRLDGNPVRYYSFDANGFREFIDELYSSLADSGLWGEIWQGVRNSIFDISDYVKQCWWCPEDVRYGQVMNKILVGHISLTGLHAYRIRESTTGACIRWSESFDIEDHPKTASRGSYCNLSPFTSRRLIYYPWGVIDIPTPILSGRRKLGVEVRVEGVTGEGMLRIYAYNPPASVDDPPTDLIDIAVRCCQYLVPIPITFSASNMYGVGQNATYEAINRTYASKVATSMLTTIHAISGLGDLLLPALSTSGKSGSTLSVNYERNGLISEFFNIADDDNDSNGRPLCKVRKPVNIPGYIEGESNSFSAPATESEMAEVKRFIENGFYYE